jgi:hypothetical protein
MPCAQSRRHPSFLLFGLSPGNLSGWLSGADDNLLEICVLF